MSDWYKQRARLTSDSRMKGKADYRDRPKKGTIEQRLKIKVEKAAPNTEYDVFFNGGFLAVLTTNSEGRGKLKFRHRAVQRRPQRPRHAGRLPARGGRRCDRSRTGPRRVPGKRLKHPPGCIPDALPLSPQTTARGLSPRAVVLSERPRPDPCVYTSRHDIHRTFLPDNHDLPARHARARDAGRWPSAMRPG